MPRVTAHRPSAILVLGGSGFVGRHVVRRARRRPATRRRADAAVATRRGICCCCRRSASSGRRRARRRAARLVQRRRRRSSISSASCTRPGATRSSGARRLRARAGRGVRGRRRAPAAPHERARRRSGGAEPRTCAEGRSRGDRRRVRPRLDDFPAVGDLRSRGHVPQSVREARALVAGDPLAGANARFQPIYVGDVAHCFARALDDDATIGAALPLCGPNVYTLRELVRYVAAMTGNRVRSSRSARRSSTLQASVLEHLPGTLLTRDNLASMQVDSVCDGAFPRRLRRRARGARGDRAAISRAQARSASRYDAIACAAAR